MRRGLGRRLQALRCAMRAVSGSHNPIPRSIGSARCARRGQAATILLAGRIRTGRARDPTVAAGSGL
jgi:hypothetical protein